MTELISALLVYPTKAPSPAWRDWIEVAYYVSQIVVVIIAAYGLLFARGQLVAANRNTETQIKLSIQNNEIQRRILEQARLMELSHQWNSEEFITARNRANQTFKLHEEGKLRLGSLSAGTSTDLDRWIDISMIAHFFVRLKHIQASNQIDIDLASPEFKEAIEYWIMPLLHAYSDLATVERLRKALMWIYLAYNPSDPGGIKNLDFVSKS